MNFVLIYIIYILLQSIDATDNGMTVKTETTIPDKALKTETSTLTIIGAASGKFSVKSDVNDRESK
jgi:hypothetical protein